jgi:hypothetical protein
LALLAEARARISSNMLAIDARRDFWLATVDLHAAIVGGRSTARQRIPPELCRQSALHKQVKAGDKIKFDAENVNGQYTVTKIEKKK